MSYRPNPESLAALVLGFLTRNPGEELTVDDIVAKFVQPGDSRNVHAQLTAACDAEYLSWEDHSDGGAYKLGPVPVPPPPLEARFQPRRGDPESATTHLAIVLPFREQAEPQSGAAPDPADANHAAMMRGATMVLESTNDYLRGQAGYSHLRLAMGITANLWEELGLQSRMPAAQYVSGVVSQLCELIELTTRPHGKT